jgi:hypothetical protein
MTAIERLFKAFEAMTEFVILFRPTDKIARLSREWLEQARAEYQQLLAHDKELAYWRALYSEDRDLEETHE